MTKDRLMVILHDATVDRTTDGKGNIWELTLAEVKQLRIVRTIPHPAKPATAATAEELERAGEVTGHQIPTLGELLDSLPAHLELNVHTYPGPQDLAPLVAGVVGEIQQRRNTALAAEAERDSFHHQVVGRRGDSEEQGHWVFG